MFTEIYEFCAHAQNLHTIQIPKLNIIAANNEMLKAFFEYDCRTYISHISGNVDCMVGVSMVPATTILVIATNNKRKSKHYSNTDHAICIIFNKYEILYEHMDTHKQKLSLSVITFNSKCGFRFNLNFKIEHQIQTEMKPQSEIFRWLKRSRPLERNAYYFLSNRPDRSLFSDFRNRSRF